MKRAAVILLAVAALGLPRIVPAHAATADTLDVHSILQQRSTWLDSMLAPESTRLDTVGTSSLADSLDRGGAAVMRAHAPQTTRERMHLDHSIRPLAMTTYNRIDGLRLGSGLGIRLPRIANASADVAYGFASRRWQGAATLSLHPFGSGRVDRRPALAFSWSDQVIPFGPNQGAYFPAFGALVAGQDRQDYLRQRSAEIRATVWRTRRARVAFGGFVHQDFGVTPATDFAFAGGGTPIFDANPAIDAGRTRAIFVSAEREPVRRVAGGRFEAGIAGGGLGGDFEYSWQYAKLTYVPLLADGSAVRTSFAALNTAGSPPVQAAAYLGGDGNLRGYERLEFAGKRSVAARLDFEWGRDIFAATGIPVVRRLQLQFIPHVDVGTTWGDARSVAGSRGNLDGAWRSAVGLGIRRNTGYPGIASLRADISWRTDGRGDSPTVWFRIGNFDFDDDD